jgi:hypothetical protein
MLELSFVFFVWFVVKVLAPLINQDAAAISHTTITIIVVIRPAGDDDLNLLRVSKIRPLPSSRKPLSADLHGFTQGVSPASICFSCGSIKLLPGFSGCGLKGLSGCRRRE